jgi:hypothetical protein
LTPPRLAPVREKIDRKPPPAFAADANLRNTCGWNVAGGGGFRFIPLGS